MGKANTLKKKPCKICGEYSGKRNVCIKCKEEFPFTYRTNGTDPFDRLEMLIKKNHGKKSSASGND